MAVPARLEASVSVRSANTAGRLRSPWSMLVATMPGQITEVATWDAPARARSCCRLSMSPTAANFEVQYTADAGAATIPAIDAVPSTWHGTPASIMRGTNERIPWIMPRRLTPRTQSQSSRVVSHE